MNTTTQSEMVNVKVEKGHGLGYQQPSLTMQTCKKCELPKTLNSFQFVQEDRKGKICRYYVGTCKECKNAQQRDRHERNREQIIKSMQRRYQNRKEIVFSHYGQMCACCGETDPAFLVIDHINNDGWKYRRGGVKNIHSNIYQWLVSHDFPEGFQVLCANCNQGKKNNNGVCPHQSRRFNDHPFMGVPASAGKHSGSAYADHDMA